MASQQDAGADHGNPAAAGTTPQKPGNTGIRAMFTISGRRSVAAPASSSNTSVMDEKESPPTEKWSLGILNDKWTEEVPGTVLLLSETRNEPLGLQHQPARNSSSSLPSPYPETRRNSMHSVASTKKKTANGQILLDPQPDDSLNDPLNWPAWRRDCALVTLGFYCMVGGGMTPILAAGFNNVAATFNVSYQRVALTTGLYMMGLGIGSVIFSPTAILFGKRPVYLFSAIIFILTSIWCAKSPNFANLATARVFQGISVSPVECLPSATIAEIFFLHERAFRVGIYTLLLLGGKNLIPLVSAAIIQSMEWRWVFWIVAMVVGFGLVTLFLFVPETFWDRTPRPKSRRPTMARRSISSLLHHRDPIYRPKSAPVADDPDFPDADKVMTPRQMRLHGLNAHARFVESGEAEHTTHPVEAETTAENGEAGRIETQDHQPQSRLSLPLHSPTTATQPDQAAAENPGLPHLHNTSSPYSVDLERNDDYLSRHTNPGPKVTDNEPRDTPAKSSPDGSEQTHVGSSSDHQDASRQGQPLTKFLSAGSVESDAPRIQRYTTALRHAPPKSYVQTLKPWNGRLTRTSWFRVAFRPFVLFAYPSVLWSTLVYSLSVGWLIVLSESVSSIYRNKDSYNFSALGTGLVYLSPFIGGVLGTVVAGKVSDILVRFLSRRNGGVYEPEFRLIMAAPVMITTAIGLMGFGWSAQERDKWIVPTIFFGVISFGCSLGSTTAITFCVDSYRQYAGEALVTLNFSKNIFHGLVFSLFFPHWLESDGSKRVFLAIGGMQVACLLTTIPMYAYGKRCRMWTVRRKFMEKF